MSACDKRERVRGMFLGLAIGDALGTPIETRTAEEIRKRYGRICAYHEVPASHEWHRGKPLGGWTDDTQLSLAIAESLIAMRGIDMDDIAARHVALLPTAKEYGWGGSTRESVERLAKGIHWSESGKTDKLNRGMGNGIAMKVSPIGALTITTARFGNLTKPLNQLAWMTHDSGMAVASARAQITTINNCLVEEPVTFSSDWCAGTAYHSAIIGEQEKQDATPDRLSNRLLALSNLCKSGALATMTDDAIIQFAGGGTCYVYNSLPMSYAFFLRNPRSIETLYDVVNAGGDTDTNGSIVGALLGALNGESIFPKHLVDGLWKKDEVLDVADRFCTAFSVW